MPKISVIIPVYQAEQFIQESIQSVLHQTFRDLELIIVTNGNHLPTIEKIKEINDPRIRHIFLEKADVVEAINAGISNSTSEFIARLDADDNMPEDRLLAQYEYLTNQKTMDIVSGKVVYQGNETENQGYYLHVQWLNSLATCEDIYSNRFVDAPVANPSLMIRKSVFDKYGLYKKGTFPEDYEMMLRWLHHGIRIGKVESTVLHWRDHPDRATRNHPMYSREAFMRVKARYLARWFEKKGKKKDILIWGISRVIRQLTKELVDQGFEIKGFIDIKRHDNSDFAIPIYHFEEIPKGPFILSMVSDRNGRKDIHQFLIDHGFQEGEDFYMLS